MTEIDTEIEDSEYILINFYNAYNETEQLNALDELTSLLSTSELICVT